MDFKRIYESANQGVNLFFWDKTRVTLADLETLVNKIESYKENEWDGYYPMPRVFIDFIDDGRFKDLFFGMCDCDANIDTNNFNGPDNPVDVELFFDEKKVSLSELKNIFNDIQKKDSGYDEFYLDLEKVEGNKLFFSEGYDEKD